MSNDTPSRGIAAIARTQPDTPAIHHHDGTTWTYGDLNQRADGIAHALAATGVGPGDRVAVMVHNRPEVFAVWTATARVGGLVVPISYRAAPAEVRYLVEDSSAKVLVHDRDEAPVGRGVGDLAAVWSVEDSATTTPSPTPVVPARVESQVSWMNYTSGTTGAPKGIVRPAPEPASEAPPQPFAQFWGFGPGRPHLLCGPAYHTAPGAYAQMSLVEGGPVVVMHPFDAEQCLQLIDQYRVTSSHMVPANFVRILQLDEKVRDRYDLSSVERIVHAAAPCPEPVKREIMEVFPPGSIWEYYGASEGMGTVISPQEWLEHPGSVGRPFPGLDIAIRDERGRSLPPNEVGTIYLAPVSGYEFEYHGSPAKTEEAWDRDRFTVGDLGWVDEDGYLYIADRRTDLILRGGANIYPAEVESALAGHPRVVDSAVVGLPHEELGQKVHAVLELDSPVTREELRDFLTEHLADYKLPTSWEFVDELPREPNGKIRKAELREATLASTSVSG